MADKTATHNLKPFLERVTFSNTRLEKLERGDLLYFGYAGDREDIIINPCIIFSGVNKETGFLEGVNMRMFFIERHTNLASSTLAKYGDFYWEEIPDEDDENVQPTFQKKKVSYVSPVAFTYENLGLYSMAKTVEMTQNKRSHVNLMEKYWRSYDPIKMRLLNDKFTKLSNNNICVNLQVANAIIHEAPTRLIKQSRIEA